MDNVSNHDELMHIGTMNQSGRYKRGSGEDPYQSGRELIGAISKLEKQGLTEVEIARGLGFKSTQELRSKKSNAKLEIAKQRFHDATAMRERGMSYTAIAEKLGMANESSVRALLATKSSVDGTSVSNYKAKLADNTRAMLVKSVEEKKYIDIGAGVEHQLGISPTVMKNAVQKLKDEGYEIHYLKVDQPGTGEKTSMKVLTAPGVPWSEVAKNQHQVALMNAYTEDRGRTWLGIEKPAYVSRKEVVIKYDEDGGTERDGLIEVRRGIPMTSMGDARYVQARVAVEGDMYMKGMVVYSDDLPPGVNFRYNVNKKKGTPDEKVFKPMKRLKQLEDGSDDPNSPVDDDNPFGATIKQRHYVDTDGTPKLSPLNIVNEEGDWDKWSKNLPSQMLSKQSTGLAKQQLNATIERRQKEFDEIMSLTNPAVKEKLLLDFSDGADAAAVHLKAAAMPRQGTHVILPFPKMKENEVYAPNFRDGERVVLVRFPHAGQFEIPELIVNNKYAEARKTLGNAKDAIGISHKVAERLSGADFDGDTALVIPNNNRAIKTMAPLDALNDFDPKALYKLPDDAPRMSSKTKGTEMGRISNLITDMSMKGANPDELARAARHSMVVIDAEKHHLDYKQSEKDHRIPELKAKFQGGATKGASTLISRSTSEARVDNYKDGGIDKETGKKIKIRIGDTYIDRRTGEERIYEGDTYKEQKKVKAGQKYRDPETGTMKVATEDIYVDTGKTISRQHKSQKMAEVDDAFELSSGSPMETVYANHANKLKDMANKARKEMVNLEMIPYSPAAKKVYAKEVQELDAALKKAQSNAPRERQAILLANKIIAMKKADKPEMDNAELKKIKGQALDEARFRTGAHKDRIVLTDKQWEAIQAGSISTNKLKQILLNADSDRVKELATPRSKEGISTIKEARAKAMLQSGATPAEVADALGVSVSTIRNL